jgi:TonB family protein
MEAPGFSRVKELIRSPTSAEGGSSHSGIDACTVLPMRALIRIALLTLVASCAFAQATDEPLRISKPVKVLKKVNPIYPQMAMYKGIQGRVLMDAIVAPNGKVRETQLVEGNQMLADAFKSALNKWRFEPQLRDGKPIAFITRVAMTFANDQPGMRQTRVPADPSADPKVVKVAPGVASGNLITRVAPIYPREAHNEGIEGTVVLHARIGTDGAIHDLQLISGPPELTESAMDAVRLWRYKPYTVNGQPVPVDTTISVNFHFGR